MINPISSIGIMIIILIGAIYKINIILLVIASFFFYGIVLAIFGGPSVQSSVNDFAYDIHSELKIIGEGGIRIFTEAEYNKLRRNN